MKNKFSRLLFLIFFIACSGRSYAQVITTIAGGGTSGLGDGGPAMSCQLAHPYKTALDASGNLYIADADNYRVRKVSPAIGGIITTIAGMEIGGYGGDDSAATGAKLNEPSGVVVDGSGNIYISDNGNHRIRKINTSGIITTIAGTGVYGYNGDNIAATNAELYSPHGIALDGSGNLYICDVLNNRLRKVNLTSGIITTIAGTGSGSGYSGDGGLATATVIGQPFGVAIDPSGNVFFADVTENRVFKINTEGVITTVAGTATGGYNGDNIPATNAELKQPFDVVLDYEGNIYIADVYNNRIRKVDNSGIITTIAGTGVSGFSGDGEPATAAKIYATGVTVDGSGDIFIADFGNLRIRYIQSILSSTLMNDTIGRVDIYPNPTTTGSFVADIISRVNDQVHIDIINMLGEKVKKIVAVTNKLIEIQLDIPNGIYFLSATTENMKITKRLIIER